MDDAQKKAILHSGVGLNEDMLKRPLRAEESAHRHRMLEPSPCHDCGGIVDKGETFISSRILIERGYHSTTFNYAIHEACYEILGRVMMVAPLDAGQMWGVGRPPLWKIWHTNRDKIRAAAPALADQLEAAFK